MNCRTLWLSIRVIAVVALAAVAGAVAQAPAPLCLSGVINDYSPATTVTPPGPWEIRGPWTLKFKREGGKADFSAALTMELSDYSRNPGNVDSTSGTTSRSQHTHHITIENGTVTPIQTGGFELSGPATITKDGGPAPLAASMLYVDITGGPDVEFSNITMKFEGGATVHFGSQTIHGVVRNPDKRDGDRD
jgi:hypothetical protein